ncbi:ParB N-terminal domain-containing protein [Globicatella sp. PHS-GS-PNBC-21-1553]|uniref:ParB N-terminal domain-containing protein n=1 Tax=Globicatella sp. PHS-GS-PNBC-21-1553 TaxID=2885764 RepID=UPI00298ED9EE|nr:ParB N-terminal domain-containing protein [Globicatella sp. PHS-GS-PNBC-21-1553]WPC08789.1 ParB N-terminal domain-containing protein [Globicatella sp. PHS-GS-PNBC-21-1553]
METKYLNLNELELDIDNPRFSMFHFENENEIISYLTEYENLNTLMKSIQNHGYISLGEPLIVLKNNKSDKFVVLEGNRRVAALKLLKSKGIHLSDTIRCDIVDSRNDALYKISAKHISGIQNWSAIDKKIFYEKQFDTYLKNGFNSKEALNKIEENSEEKKSVIKKDISSFYFVKDIYDLVKQDNPNLPPLSKLGTDIITGRIFNRLQTLLNIKMNEKLKFNIPAQKVKIYNDILYVIGKNVWIDGVVDSRLLNKNKDFEKALNNELKELGILIEQYTSITSNKSLNTEDNSKADNYTLNENQLNNESQNTKDNIDNTNLQKNTSNTYVDEPITKKGKEILTPDIVKIYPKNEILELNQLPYDLKENIVIHINDKIVPTKNIVFKSKANSTLFLNNSIIESQTPNSTYSVDYQYKELNGTFTIKINVPIQVENINLMKYEIFSSLVKSIEKIQFDTKKILLSLSILERLNLSLEEDKIIASPIIRNFIEYTISLYIEKYQLNIILQNNLPGAFNSVKDNLNQKFNCFEKNQLKQLKTVKDDLETINSYIHDKNGIPSSEFLISLFENSLPAIEKIYEILTVEN